MDTLPLLVHSVTPIVVGCARRPFRNRAFGRSFEANVKLEAVPAQGRHLFGRPFYGFGHGFQLPRKSIDLGRD